MSHEPILLLDYDLTLGKTDNLPRVIELAFKEQGVDADPEFLKKFHSQNFGVVMNRDYPHVDRAQFSKSVAYHEAQEEHILYPGVREALRFWQKSDVKLALFSARDAYSLNCQLKANNIQEFFDVICTSDDYAPLSKKDTGSMDKILAYWSDRGICTVNISYIGDSSVDYCAAVNNGIEDKFWAVCHGDINRRDALMASGISDNKIFNHPSEWTFKEFPHWVH
jgi:phosphoglycolate phosphatase-like HAD superfamily hydrolase